PDGVWVVRLPPGKLPMVLAIPSQQGAAELRQASLIVKRQSRSVHHRLKASVPRMRGMHLAFCSIGILTESHFYVALDDFEFVGLQCIGHRSLEPDHDA